MAALDTYRTKRKFDKTPEPRGKAVKNRSILRFVVQRHHAGRLHYDFRLELGGVLKSWALPKGPSMNPTDKRLAVHVEDHPVDYLDFQGEIPKGNYGAGQVYIWDTGTFIPVGGKDKPISQRKAIENIESGELKVVLHGGKLKGGFVLIRLKGDKNWLLIKQKDDQAVNEDYNSEDHINSIVGKGRSISRKGRTRFTGKEEKFSRFIKPMLATLHDEPFDDSDWIFEVKWDGYRAIAERKGAAFRLYSRNGLSFKDIFPQVYSALSSLGVDVILDGEIVVLDDDGKPSFQLLQQFREDPHHPIVFYVFDLLQKGRKDLRNLPLLQRKELLRHLLPRDNGVIRYCDHIAGQGRSFFDEVARMGLEGIIAKNASSRYVDGLRSRQWLKIKNQNTSEAVIIGYTRPKGSRKHFGALILGQYDCGELRYIGHTGTGFDDRALIDLEARMKPLGSRVSPLRGKIKVNSPVTWVEPKLVCAVKFAEQTRDGLLRHPVYLGLRMDKEALEVTRNNDHIDDKKDTADVNVRVAAGEDEKLVTYDGHRVRLTNLNKVYWPDRKITKGTMLAYYDKMAPVILPYLKDRPLSLKRFVNGISGKAFYHKDAGENAPSFVVTEQVESGSSDKIIDYIVCNNKATLMYVANLGSIEMNPWNSKRQKPDHPTYIVIDIDPSEGNSFEQVIETAMATRDVLERAGATYHVKTSGATGLHVYVPLGHKYEYEQAKNFAHIVAMLTQELVPDLTTLERMIKKRGNRIYLDYLQNGKGQTLASAYSVRPVPGAQVSAPLAHYELKPGLRPDRFNIFTMRERVEKLGDLFFPVLGKGNNIRNCLRNLGQ